MRSNYDLFSPSSPHSYFLRPKVWKWKVISSIAGGGSWVVIPLKGALVVMSRFVVNLVELKTMKNNDSDIISKWSLQTVTKSQLPPSPSKNKQICMHEPFVPTPGILHQSFPLLNRHSTPASHDLASEIFPFNSRLLFRALFMDSSLPIDPPFKWIASERKSPRNLFGQKQKNIVQVFDDPNFHLKNFLVRGSISLT